LVAAVFANVAGSATISGPQGQRLANVRQARCRIWHKPTSDGRRYVQLRATMSLAQLWSERDKRAEARDLVASVCNWFTEESNAPDLTAAKALLDELRE
jgi:hypothetical protein